jgi:hypothetical protein
VSTLNPFSNYCSISLLHGEADWRGVITDGAWSSFIRIMAGRPDIFSPLDEGVAIISKPYMNNGHYGLARVL